MGTIATAHINIPVEMALLALQGAMSEIRFIEQNAVNNSGFRDRLPVLMNELNKAIYYLSNLKHPASQTAGSLDQLKMNESASRCTGSERAA